MILTNENEKKNHKWEGGVGVNPFVNFSQIKRPIIYVAVAIRKGNLKNSQNGFSNSSTLVSAGDIIGKSGSKKNSHFAISSPF